MTKRDETLRLLYKKWHITSEHAPITPSVGPGASPICISNWSTELGISAPEVERLVGEIIQNGWARYATDFIPGSLPKQWLFATSHGLDYAEANLEQDSDLQRAFQFSRKIRRDILLRLKEALAQKKVFVTERDIIPGTNLREEPKHIVFRRMRDYLIEKGWLDMDLQSFNGGGLTFTEAGGTVFNRQLMREDLARGFEALKGCDKKQYQQRGHEFERLIANIARGEGFDVEPNVTRPGEEIDLIFHDGATSYLGSCKWLSEAVEAGGINDLFARAERRRGIRGVFFSMSGFTPNAIEAAREDLQKATILLFGPADIQHMLDGEASLKKLLETKFRASVSTISILVDGQSYGRRPA